MVEIMEYFQNLKMDYSDIIKLCEEEKLPNTYSWDKTENAYTIFSFESQQQLIIFKNEVTLKLINHKNSESKKTIRSVLEMAQYLDELKIDYKNVVVNNNEKLHLDKMIEYIDENIKDGILELKDVRKEIPDIIQEKVFRDEGENIIPLKYSKYFFDYFKYEDINSKFFKYKKSKEGREIESNLNILKKSKDIRKYKLTGPSSNGKSMTLFYISRHHPDFIYINLKVLKNSDKEKCLNIIISELSRLILRDEDIININIKLKAIDIRNPILEILLEIIEIILKNRISRNLVLILDQYKIENYCSYNNFVNKLDLLIDEFPHLKIVYCSSINDNGLRDELLETFIKFEGPILEYNQNTQIYYFYYINLFNSNSHKKQKTINWLFNKKRKYIYWFRDKEKTKKEIFDSIINKIKKKIEKFKISTIDIESVWNYSFSELLIYLKQIFNKEFTKNNIFHVLKFCPLKYVKIVFKRDCFEVNPIYPFLNYFINAEIKREECMSYFAKKKYSIYSFQSHMIKGKYFKYCAQIALKNNFIKFPNNENREITLFEIASMNKFSPSIEDIIDEYKLDKDEDDEKEEEKKEKDYEIKEKNLEDFDQKEDINNPNDTKEEIDENNELNDSKEGNGLLIISNDDKERKREINDSNNNKEKRDEINASNYDKGRKGEINDSHSKIENEERLNDSNKDKEKKEKINNSNKNKVRKVENNITFKQYNKNEKIKNKEEKNKI